MSIYWCKQGAVFGSKKPILSLVQYCLYSCSYWVMRNTGGKSDEGINSGRTSWFLDLWFSMRSRHGPVLLPMGTRMAYSLTQFEEKIRGSRS